jgi:hypothetical protein
VHARQGIRGILVPDEKGNAMCFIVCEPASHYYQIMTGTDRMPVLIGERIQFASFFAVSMTTHQCRYRWTTSCLAANQSAQSSPIGSPRFSQRSYAYSVLSTVSSQAETYSIRVAIKHCCCSSKR